jgi:hypothetical protein
MTTIDDCAARCLAVRNEPDLGGAGRGAPSPGAVAVIARCGRP